MFEPSKADQLHDIVEFMMDGQATVPELKDASSACVILGAKLNQEIERRRQEYGKSGDGFEVDYPKKPDESLTSKEKVRDEDLRSMLRSFRAHIEQPHNTCLFGYKVKDRIDILLSGGGVDLGSRLEQIILVMGDMIQLESGRRT